ncbi:MAG: hypothetical protein D6751_09785 [Deltaproteobacteria bacterium]|nr:MAG: hypothetical protein D6751_09785 [Deltaproteobacteria bacterium]
MDVQTLIDQAVAFALRWPVPVAVGGGLLVLLFLFKRKLLWHLLALALFVAGVDLVVRTIGEGLDAGVHNKDAMIHKTEKALE